MFRAKSNLGTLSVIAVAILVAGAGLYLYSKWALNKSNLEELKQKYAELKSLNEKNENSSEAGLSRQALPPKGIDTLNIRFRAVSLNWASPGANQQIGLNVLDEIKNSEYFDAAKTLPVGNLSPEVPLNEQVKYTDPSEVPGTFSFRIVAKLKRPLTL